MQTHSQCESRAGSFKSAWAICEGDSLTDLRESSGKGVTGRCHFSFIFLPVSQELAGVILALSICLVNTTCLSPLFPCSPPLTFSTGTSPLCSLLHLTWMVGSAGPSALPLRTPPCHTSRVGGLVLAFLHHDPHPTKIGWYMHSTHRKPLEHMALVARGACISGPHGTETIRETVLGRIPHPGHYIDNRLKHTSSVLVTTPLRLGKTAILPNTWKQTESQIK